MTDEIIESDLSQDESKESSSNRSPSLSLGESFTKPSYIVGVGASAGGLEALERVFANMPEESGMAFVIVQHLSPDFRSMMDELLARHTSMKIHRVEKSMPVEANCIYLNPPRQNIVIRNGWLKLVNQDFSHGVNLPIDAFFKSLAEDVGEKAIAIVLSGTGSDGTRGIGEIKEAGGLVVVQNEQSSKFDGMPRSAVASGFADFILAPEDIPQQLVRFSQNPFAATNQDAPLILRETTKLREILRLVQRDQGVDFAPYKPTTVSRRIERRMGINHIDDLDEYIQRLRDSKAETAALVKDLLIGVTRFFRDGAVWDVLKRRVIKPIIEKSTNNDRIRVWVPACATGEEAYSIAILFAECLDEMQSNCSVKIFASDIDAAAVDFAGAAVYHDTIAGDLSSERLKNFFRRQEGKYTVNRAIREMVIFARQNIVSDPPFTKLDLVSCRNLLIYLQPAVQKRVLSLLHFALKPDGAVWLGSSESIGDLAHAFRPIDEKSRLFGKNPHVSLDTYRQEASRSISDRLNAPLVDPDSRFQPLDRSEGPLRIAFRTIADLYSPQAVLLNSDYEVLHTFGDISCYFRIGEGAFTADITKNVIEELNVALATALYRAARDGKPVIYRDIIIRRDSEAQKITLSVRPVGDSANANKYYLVFFEEDTPPEKLEDGSESFKVDSQRDARILDLEHQLQQTKENLQATIEELETSNEELQSSNEELLASNEELQSTNEELHSVNEELFTVNTEHQAKIRELTQLTNDFDNLLRSTDIGVVFVDRDLCIRKFTRSIADAINLVDHDIGRPIAHITHNLDLDQESLVEDVQGVMSLRQAISKEVFNRNGTPFFMRVNPFLDEEDYVNGAVISLVDITRLREKEQALIESEDRFRKLFDDGPLGMMLTNKDRRIVRANHKLSELLGYSIEELHQADVSELVYPEDRDLEEKLRKELFEQSKVFFEVDIRLLRRDGSVVWVSLYKNLVLSAEGESLFALGVLRDISLEREKNDRLRTTANQLEQSNRELEQFASVVSHDLQEPLRTIKGFLQLAQEKGEEGRQDAFENYFPQITASVDLMQQRISDFLKLARLYSIELELEDVNLNEVVLNSVVQLKTSIDQSNALVSYQKLPIVRANSSLLSMVFQNLIENAIKYRSEANPEITIEAKDTAREVTVFVRDNGIGIRAEHHLRIFQLFRRLHTQREFPGTGIGLALVKKIVEQHGGKVWVESEEQKGSTFVFTLPKE